MPAAPTRSGRGHGLDCGLRHSGRGVGLVMAVADSGEAEEDSGHALAVKQADEMRLAHDSAGRGGQEATWARVPRRRARQ